MNIRLILSSVAILLVGGCTNINKLSSKENETKTAQFYDSLINRDVPNVAQLNLFFTAMPKGGDLHIHYSGSLYVETYLDWVKQKGWWIDNQTLHILKEKTEHAITVKALRSDSAMYSKLLSLWSDKDFHNHTHEQLPPDTTFFNTFGYFSPIAKQSHTGLQILKNRAIKENICYIELMLKSTGYSLEDPSFDENVEQLSGDKLTHLFDTLANKIEHDPTFNQQINSFITKIKYDHRGIDDKQFMMRFQTYAYRNSSPSYVFSNLYAAFKATKRSPLLVGVNILGAENNPIALKYYTLHMEMFAYLSKKFPTVKKALHAGELTLGMVRPKNLTFHITQAIEIAKAQRIGHGIDLPYENNGIALLQKIKKNAVLEICLTSNEFILGVKNKAHPYLIYSAYGVPIVICTDDSGVSRNNLSNEYLKLATRYKPSYKTIKQYVYNSINYSFLSKSEKTELTQLLDERFKRFELKIATYAKLISR